jgi:hypothetical protein
VATPAAMNQMIAAALMHIEIVRNFCWLDEEWNIAEIHSSRT